ncbi:MAG: hypothetical protein CM15mP12_7430 [Gammaproteobacteria bacterium]|nr:MAG: hypothetical protein CM15mP12_7430 [Gammaproteobacteria bacterium]
MGIPGVEYFAHPYELNPGFAKKFFILGEDECCGAYEMGRVNKVVDKSELKNYK